jgi:hypothetical protein
MDPASSAGEWLNPALRWSYGGKENANLVPIHGAQDGFLNFRKGKIPKRTTEIPSIRTSLRHAQAEIREQSI